MPSCSCFSDTSVERRDLGPSEVVQGSDTDSDDEDPQRVISYNEWISRRVPIKLPPGLPRPPRQPTPAAAPSSVSTAADCDSAAVEDGDDLEDDCDEWYNRNVAAGNFPDWLRHEQHASAPSASSSSAASTTSAAAASMASQPTPPAGAVCSDEDLEEECDQWFIRNVAAGLFSAAWLTSDAVSTSTLAASSAPNPSVASVEPGAEAAPASSRSEVTAAAAAAATVFAEGDAPFSASASCAWARQEGSPAVHAATLHLIPVGADADDSHSLPSSPTGSDCRATSDGGFCYSSRATSRSCSSTSLGSMDGEEGLLTGGSGSEDDEVVAAAERGRESEEGQGGCKGELGWIGCEVRAEQGAPSVRQLGLCALGGAGAMLRLVDCGSWERELEAAAMAGPEERGEGAVSEGCGVGTVVGGVAGAAQLQLREGVWEPCGGELLWLETQLERLLEDVVIGALFT